MLKTVLRHVLVILIFACGPNAQADTVELVTTEYPPYYGKDLKNSGFLSEIIVAAFERSGYAVNINFLPWQRAFDGTKAGKYPALYTMWYREDREEWFAFSDPLTPNELGFLKRVDNQIPYKEYADLNPYTIGVVRGYSNPAGFDEAGLNTEEVKEDRLNVLKLFRERLDLILIDKIMGQHILNTEHDEKKNEVEWLATVQTDPQYLVFSKKAPGYEKKLNDFNKGLKAITDDGTLEEIMASHGF